MLKFTQFCNFYRILLAFLKTAAQAFEVGDFFLRFWGI